MEADESEVGKAVEEAEPKRGPEVLAVEEAPKRLPVLPKLVEVDVAPKEVPEEAPKGVPEEAPKEVPPVVDLNPDEENPLTPEGIIPPPPPEPPEAPKAVPPEAPNEVPVPPEAPNEVPVPVPNPLAWPLEAPNEVPVAPNEVPVAPNEVPVEVPEEAAPKAVPADEANEVPVPNFEPPVLAGVLEKPELGVELEKVLEPAGVVPKREEVEGVNPLVGAVVVAVVEPNKLLTSVVDDGKRAVAPPPPLPNAEVPAAGVPQVVAGVWLGFVVAAALKAANGFATIAVDGEEKLKAAPLAPKVAVSLCDAPPNIGFAPNAGLALVESLVDVDVNVLVLLLRDPKAGFAVEVGDEVEPAPNLANDGPVAVLPNEVPTGAAAVSFAVDGANGVILGNVVVGFSTSLSFGWVIAVDGAFFSVAVSSVVDGLEAPKERAGLVSAGFSEATFPNGVGLGIESFAPK